MAGRVLLWQIKSVSDFFSVFIFEIQRMHKASLFENSLQLAANVCDLLDLLILFVNLSDS